MSNPQNLAHMSWANAPDWATHIVGWFGEYQTCLWAVKQGDRYFCEDTRAAGLFSFGLVDSFDPGDRFGWVVLGQRPDERVLEICL